MTGPEPLPRDTWSHLALIYDGNKLRLYVDGELVATNAVPTHEGVAGR